MNKLRIALAVFSLAVFFTGCASDHVTRTQEENTTRVISSEPQIGQPVKSNGP